MNKPVSLIFLLLLLVLHVCAVPTKTQVETNNQNPDLANGFQPLSITSSVDSNTLGVDSTKKSFNFFIGCYQINSVECLRAKVAAFSVEKRLNILFNLKSTIEIKVFVPRMDFFPEESTIQAGTSTNKYVAVRIPELAEDGKRVPVKCHRTSFVDGYEGVYRVPLALAKQMDLGDTLKNQYTMVEESENFADFYIVINTRKPFFLKGEGKFDFDHLNDLEGSNDLEAILMHEVLVRDPLLCIIFFCSFRCGVESLCKVSFRCFFFLSFSSFVF
jgi:hypothetical protein